MKDRLLLTIAQAAAALNLGRSTIYELVNSGELKVVKIGRSARIPVVELQAFVDRRTDTSV